MTAKQVLELQKSIDNCIRNSGSDLDFKKLKKQLLTELSESHSYININIAKQSKPLAIFLTLLIWFLSLALTVIACIYGGNDSDIFTTLVYVWSIFQYSWSLFSGLLCLPTLLMEKEKVSIRYKQIIYSCIYNIVLSAVCFYIIFGPEAKLLGILFINVVYNILAKLLDSLIVNKYIKNLKHILKNYT